MLFENVQILFLEIDTFNSWYALGTKKTGADTKWSQQTLTTATLSALLHFLVDWETSNPGRIWGSLEQLKLWPQGLSARVMWGTGRPTVIHFVFSHKVPLSLQDTSFPFCLHHCVIFIYFAMFLPFCLVSSHWSGMFNVIVTFWLLKIPSYFIHLSYALIES